MYRINRPAHQIPSRNVSRLIKQRLMNAQLIAVSTPRWTIITPIN